MFKEIVNEIEKDIIKENVEKCDAIRISKGLFHLNELNINRIKSHGEDGFIIISSNKDRIVYENPKISLESEFEDYLKNSNEQDSEDIRERWLAERNRICQKRLTDEVKNSIYSYSKVFGGYKDLENGISSFEPSFIIYNKDRNGNTLNFDELYAFALQLCKEYKQDSVYINRPGMAPIYVDMDGNKVNSTESKNMKINRDDQEYFTTTKRDKTDPQRFTSDIQFENIYREQGIDMIERIKRIQHGEFLIQ